MDAVVRLRTDLILMFVLFVSGEVNSVCFPGESIEECRKSEGLNVELRSPLLTGRGCFASGGYYGSCRQAKDCVKSDYSYSRTCGWTLTCCKSYKEYNNNSAVKFSQTTRRPSYTTRTTTNRPTRNSVVRQYPGCGKPATSFVLGGTEAKRGALPFMVSFIQVFRDGSFQNFCGGVLITQRHVLSAAHCFSSLRQSDYRSGRVDVRLGTHDLSEKEDFLARADIQNVKPHPDYRQRGAGVVNPVHDLAIVTLTRNVTSSQVIPVCLPGEVRGRRAVVAGWGRTTQGEGRGSVTKLRFAYVTEFSRSECQAKYDRNVRDRVAITDSMLCAGNAEADSCSGDSGGPLLWSENRSWTVGGVTSFGPSSCGNKIPGVYIKVKDYLPWIYSNIDGYL